MKLPISKAQIFCRTIEDLNQYLEPFEFENPVEVTIKPFSNKRSIPQNKTFYMWMSEMSAYCIPRYGKHWTPKFCKDAMKHSFIGYEESVTFDVYSGKYIKDRRLKSTTKLSTGEFFFFMTQIEQYNLSIGCLLTIPNECEYMKLKRKQNE